MFGLMSFIKAGLLSSAFGEFGSMVGDAKHQVDGIAGTFVSLMLVVLGLAGITGCVIGFIKYSKGEPGSDNALLKVGVGLIISVIVIYAIVKAFHIQL